MIHLKYKIQGVGVKKTWGVGDVRFEFTDSHALTDGDWPRVQFFSSVAALSGSLLCS